MRVDENMVSFPADTIFPAFPPDLKHTPFSFSNSSRLPRLGVVVDELMDTEKTLTRITRNLLAVLHQFKSFFRNSF